MKSTALTLTSDKYFERYARFITEAEGTPQRITSPEDLDDYDVLVLSGGGDMGIKSGAYGDQTDNLPIGGVNDDRDELEKQLLGKARSTSLSTTPAAARESPRLDCSSAPRRTSTHYYRQISMA